MTKDLILSSTQDIGDIFDSNLPFMVYLETYTDGWFIEFARRATPDADKNWTKYHERPFESSPGREFLIFPGSKDLVFRMNSGTQGAVAYKTPIELAVFR